MNKSGGGNDHKTGRLNEGEKSCGRKRVMAGAMTHRVHHGVKAFLLRSMGASSVVNV